VPPAFRKAALTSSALCLEPLLQAISDFLDDQKDIIEQVRCDLTRGLKKVDTRRSGLPPQQVLRSLVLMRVKNWNYREFRGDCRRMHTAPVHGLLLSASASIHCVPPRLQSAHARDAQGDQ
jgi:hypothetical protein